MPNDPGVGRRRGSKRRTQAAFSTRWLLLRDRVAGFVLASAAALPFLETLLYNAHVGAGRSSLNAPEYLALALLVILLWLSMVVSFLIEPKSARELLQRLRAALLKGQRLIRQRALLALVLMPVVLGLVILAGGPIAQLLSWFDTLQAVLLPLLQMLAVAVVIWFVAALIRATADLREDLVGAMGSWAFCLRVSVGFYLLLTLATLLVIRTDGIRPEARLEFRLAVVKDYFLLFIITGMLYLGLFRLAVAQRLAAVFRSIKGFIEFMVICALIAILAIWADFNSTSPAKQAANFYHPWQNTYNVVHVYVRDIGLLLMPIAVLLYWTLRHVARELKAEEHQQAGPSTS